MSDKYEIIIVAEDYPGYGGFGTYAYNIFKILSNNYQVALVYLLKEEVYAKFFINFKINNIYHYYLSNFDDIFYHIDDHQKFNKYDDIWKKFLKWLQENHINRTRILISISPKTLSLANYSIKYLRHIYRMGNIHGKKMFSNIWEYNDMSNLQNITIEYYPINNILLNNPNIEILPNSPLTEHFANILKEKLGLNNKIHHHIILTPYELSHQKNNVPKKYDIIYVSSDLSRKIKNFNLAFYIFKHFPNNTKILVGRGSTKYVSKFSNVIHYEYLENTQLVDLISKCRILILTSQLDAGPNVILEAIISKTIPIMYYMTGFVPYFNNQYICKTFELNEWTSKIENILKNYNNINFNKEFSKIIDRILNDKYKLFHLLDEYLCESYLLDYLENNNMAKRTIFTFDRIKKIKLIDNQILYNWYFRSLKENV
jgi:glycosyltransferase involved in cell wall biosynthesis